jgi:predicted outer membrane protein
MNGMGGQDMAAMQSLQNATGTEFNTLFVSQMLTMHEAKLSELQTAATTLTDPELKLLVTKAIPKIRMHRDTLAKMSKGGSASGNGAATQQ